MNHFPFHPDSSCPDSSCKEVQDNLEAYLADELDTTLQATIATHIGYCSACQKEVRFAQAIRGAFHELPKPEPPPKIFNTVAAYVRAHPDKGPKGLKRIFQVFTFSDDLPSTLVRVGALACLIGVVLFGTYQYQQHLKVQQASRDLAYALGKLNYAVERTERVVNEKLPDVRIDELSNRPFVQIETASRYVSKQRKHISSAIHRSLENLDR